MKSLAIFFLVFSFGLFCAQNDSAANTKKTALRHNEINIGLTPAVFFLIDARNTVPSAAWSLAYRRYLRKDNVFRMGAEIYPNSVHDHSENTTRLDRQIDSINIYRSYGTQTKPLFQAFIGAEILFPKDKFTQGIACDMGVFARKYIVSENYFWLPKSQSASQDYSSYFINGNMLPQNNQIDYSVDSLSYSYTTQTYGLSFKFLYTLRRELPHHFYLNASVGPILWLARSRYSATSGLRAPRRGDTWFYINGSFFAADVSISYRF